MSVFRILPKPPTATATPEGYENPSINSGIVNILLIGADYAPERESWDKNYYSDVMLILAINFDAKEGGHDICAS